MLQQLLHTLTICLLSTNFKNRNQNRNSTDFISCIHRQQFRWHSDSMTHKQRKLLNGWLILAGKKVFGCASCMDWIGLGHITLHSIVFHWFPSVKWRLLRLLPLLLALRDGVIRASEQVALTSLVTYFHNCYSGLQKTRNYIKEVRWRRWLQRLWWR